LLVEAELWRRGWTAADSPASAGLLIVCGTPVGGLAEAVETVWAEMPSPRAKAEMPPAPTREYVAQALDEAAERLRDRHAQWADAAARASAGWTPQSHLGEGHSGHMSHGRGDQPGEHGGHDAYGHHMDHMGAPGGLAMAERGPDRDGLKLDRLHVPLGPVLPDWPAGLVVETVLQGDVIQEAAITILTGEGDRSFWDAPWLDALDGRPVTRGEGERHRAASHLDSLSRLLAVAGWPTAATRARRLRDRVLEHRPTAYPPQESQDLAGLEREYARFARRVGRSRVLRWMLRGDGVIEAGGSAGDGIDGSTESVTGDAAARLDAWLTATASALPALTDPSPLTSANGPRGPIGAGQARRLLDSLPALLHGTDLTSARLIVASLDPDIDQLNAPHEPTHA
jgi:hypothetical protein